MAEHASLIPVILSGGSGSRLWPLSRAQYPKQFQALAGPRSLFRETVGRVMALDFCGAPLVIANDAHRFLVAEQLREGGISPEAIILEPQGRNTAAAAAIAALYLSRKDPDAVLALLPSDHVIQDAEAFAAALEKAVDTAARGHLVAFGITATRPDTGYGYIECGTALAAPPGVFRLAQFFEKPDRKTAESLVADGLHLWNSGMFVTPAALYLAELERFEPEILKACDSALSSAVADIDFLRLDARALERAPSLSIDVAVMERTERAAVIPIDIGWSDVGAWSALWDLADKDESGNATVGRVAAQDLRGCYLHSTDGRLLTAIGLEDYLVVSTADATLVAPRRQAKEVKGLVERLEAEGYPEAVEHRTTYRPWGNYTSIDASEDPNNVWSFRVKRIVVKASARLSLQKHNHRSEHWVVVAGCARVTLGDEVRDLHPNESTYIPRGMLHRLENPGLEPLHLIEVQIGDHVSEEDIERFEDDYGR
jgi:mannose-1-phosphate guanylyltransferase/mannose-6-phosphate isomerase